ncbi:MAG: hypothetical protein V3W04_10340 [Gammaproteobacteria bacterium]
MPVPEPKQPFLRLKVNELLDTINQRLKNIDISRQQAADLELLEEAFNKLYDTMATSDSSAHNHDLSALGEYALNLCAKGQEIARQLQLSTVIAEFEKLATTLALWIVRNGGELLSIEMVVDGYAKFANETHSEEELTELFSISTELMQTMAAPFKLDLDKSNPGRPWRILNLNRAIVATRTLQPAIMEDAFKLFTDNMPEEAAQFFSEGMQQMERANYPVQVRQVMESWFRRYPRTL